MPPARSLAGFAALFAAVCALAFGLAGWMYAVRLEQTLAEVEASRLRFTLGDLQADFEKSLDRGFSIGQLTHAQAALEAEARQDPDILSLTVLGENGRRLFHTGGKLPANALQQGKAFRRDADAISATTSLTYNDGAPAGVLLLRYSNRGHDGIMRALLLRLALFAGVATMLSTLAFMAWLRALERRRQALGAQVDKALGAARIPAGTEAELAELVDNVNQISATALVELTAARHAVSEPEAAR